MTVYGYLELKRKKTNLQACISCTPKDKVERRNAMFAKLDQLAKEIAEAEKEQCVCEYLSMLKRKGKLLQTIGSWKFHKKDVSGLEEKLKHLIERIEDAAKEEPTMGPDPDYTEETTPAPKPKAKPAPKPQTNVQVKPVSTTPFPPVVYIHEDQLAKILDSIKPVGQPSQELKRPAEPTYYIINLAWSGVPADDNNLKKILTTVSNFLNKSNHISVTDSGIFDRVEGMVVWTFAYDTPEEQSQAKMLRVAASHLVDSLKEWVGQKYNIEIFGKMQKY